MYKGKINIQTASLTQKTHRIPYENFPSCRPKADFFPALTPVKKSAFFCLTPRFYSLIGAGK